MVATKKGIVRGIDDGFIDRGQVLHVENLKLVQKMFVKELAGILWSGIGFGHSLGLFHGNKSLNSLGEYGSNGLMNLMPCWINGIKFFWPWDLGTQLLLQKHQHRGQLPLPPNIRQSGRVPFIDYININWNSAVLSPTWTLTSGLEIENLPPLTAKTMVIENYFDSETTTNRSSKLAGKVIILLPLSRIAKKCRFLQYYRLSFYWLSF